MRNVLHSANCTGATNTQLVAIEDSYSIIPRAGDIVSEVGLILV